MRRALLSALFLMIVGCLDFGGARQRFLTDVDTKSVAADLHAKIVTLHDQLTQSIVQVRTESGWGTGFCVAFIDKTAYFLTASHVVHDGKAKKISIQYMDGELYFEEDCKLITCDKDRDFALLSAKLKRYIWPIMGDAEYTTLKAGDLLMACGIGDEATPGLVTIGVIDNISVKIFEGPEYDRWLRHSASIWYGFSGGPVVDVRSGKVVGMNLRLSNGAPGHYDSSKALSQPSWRIAEFLDDHLPKR